MPTDTPPPDAAKLAELERSCADNHVLNDFNADLIDTQGQEIADLRSQLAAANARAEKMLRTMEHVVAHVENCDYMAALDRLRAALSRPATTGGGGWRPIETAPKDGTTVITGAWVWCEDTWEGEQREDYFGNYHGRNPDGSNCSWWPLDDADGNKVVTPTHFHTIARPPKMPPAPAAEGK